MNLYPHFRLLHDAPARSAWTLELSVDAERKAWIVPHGPPTRPHDRHLAIERLDDGERPAASPACWDAGPAEIRKWQPRHVVVVLHGARLRGCFALIRVTRATHAHWLWLRVNPRAHSVVRRSRAAASVHQP